MTMSKVSVFDEKEGKFQTLSATLPELGAGEILVKVLYTTICRSDIYTYQGKRKEKNPAILGHEIVGQIIKFASDAPEKDLRGFPLRVGSRITWAIYASNPEDPRSKMGMPQKAADLFKYGHEAHEPGNSFHGGMAEHIILRRNTPVIAIGSHIPDKSAALINCSVATVSAAIRLAGNLRGKKVLVNGAGMLGFIACAMAHSMHAESVIAADTNSDRLKKSMMFGASGVFKVPENTAITRESYLVVHGSVDVVLDFSGIPSSIEAVMSLLDIGGTIVLVGSTFPQEDIRVNAELIVRKLLTIRGIHNYNAKDLIHAVAFMESNVEKFGFDQLVENEFTLDESNQAFEYAVQHNPFRVGIKPL